MTKKRHHTVFGGLAASAALVIAALTAAAPAEGAGAVMFVDGFDGPTINTGAWQVLGPQQAPNFGTKSQAWLLPENARVESGLLRIAARRHCTSGTPTMGNVSSSPCNNLNNTKYSTGRVQGLFRTPHGSAFEMRVSARIPGGIQPGTRAAVWAKNNQPYCESVGAKTSLGEFDLIEAYGTRPTLGDSTTHMSCSGVGGNPWARESAQHKVGFSPGSFYEWIVQREGNWVSYFIQAGGGQAQHIGSHVCGQGEFAFSQARCDEIMNDPFALILQQEIFASNATGPDVTPGPKATSHFGVQYLDIDWVRISYLR